MSDMPEPDQEENEEVIVPHFKMILAYDVLPNNHDNYYQFILGEMLERPGDSSHVLHPQLLAQGR
jgi:hypothetical protein